MNYGSRILNRYEKEYLNLEHELGRRYRECFISFVWNVVLF